MFEGEGEGAGALFRAFVFFLWFRGFDDDDDDDDDAMQYTSGARVEGETVA